MKFRKIYFILLIIVTALILIIYVYQENEYKKEVAKIEQLEQAYKKKAEDLQKIRSTLTMCHVPNLVTPRSCYFDSGYQCTWAIDAETCVRK